MPVSHNASRRDAGTVECRDDFHYGLLEYHHVSTSPEVIRSRSNRRYQRLRMLAGSCASTDCPWVMVEGWKQVSDLSRTHEIEILIYSRDGDPRLAQLQRRSRQCLQFSEPLFRTISGVDHPQGIAAFFSKREWTWADLGPFVLYAHEVQDPGNLGTLLRTAEATGLFTLVTSPGCASCYGSKTVRASVGAALRLPLLERKPWRSLKSRGYRLWATTHLGGTSLFQARFRPPLAVLVGNEGNGLPGRVMEDADHLLHIPMASGDGSLNAGVAGSLALYEVFRREHGPE